jgi:K+-transporting ATPase ATPase C chain
MKKGSLLKTTFIFFLVMTIVTGFIYPLFVTGIAQLVFPFQANGSLAKIKDGIRGSYLIAQEFSGDGFFHARPSAGSYGTVPSGASNRSPAANALKSAVEKRKAAWQDLHGPGNVPNDMLYASGSGLDPDISVESAMAQVDRIVKARGLTDGQKSELTGMIGLLSKTMALFPSPARVNVMELNMKLEYDPQFGQHPFPWPACVSCGEA